MQTGEGSRRGPKTEHKASRDHKDNSKAKQPIYQDPGASRPALVIQAGKLHHFWATSLRLEGLLREELPGLALGWQLYLPR